MLSIIIADDETGIIDLCRALIDYPDAHVIGEAHNGLELLEKIGTLHPNTVITDINMPGLTGLELIEKVQTVYPDVNFIVMSGYTDFEYVQTALRYGVWDYLLKPLQKSELNRILKKLDAHLESQYQQAQYQQSMLSSLDESLELLQQWYVRELWERRKPVPIPEMKSRKVFALSGKTACWIILRQDGRIACPEMRRATQSRSISTALELIAEHAENNGYEAVFTDTDDDVVGLLLFLTESAEKCWKSLEGQLKARLRQLNTLDALTHLTCAASSLLPAEISIIPQAAEQAATALEWRLERQETPLQVYDAKVFSRSQLVPAFSHLRALHDAVLARDTEKACTLIDDAWTNGDYSVPGSRIRRMRDLMDCLKHALSELPAAEETVSPVILRERQMLMDGMEPHQISGCMQAALRDYLSAYQAGINQRENATIIRARQYIIQHQGEDISLEEVACHVGLSPTYLSALFKQEMGTGFIRYLQRIRIERAKTLLRETDRKVRDIAQEVGYRDLKHFNKIFYNETNVTPSEYRKFYK